MRIEHKTPKEIFIPVGAEGIKYSEEKTVPQLFFPATLNGVKGVMAKLPSDYLNGASHIRLETGGDYIYASRPGNDYVLDPISNRKSIAIEPGVFAPVVLGIYSPGSGRIRLFAYALETKAIIPWRTDLFLKLQMLQTLVHEISHSHDKTQRVARGRWRMDQKNKDEAYADRLASDLMGSIVFPCVLSMYRHLYHGKSD